MDTIRELLGAEEQEIASSKLPRWNELPDLELYMDQVIALIDKYLLAFLKCSAAGQVTPTMINNYVKMGVIPSPVKKRYSRAHLAYLIMVFILKQSLSIGEIDTLFRLQLETRDISELYDDFCSQQQSMFAEMLNISVSEDMPLRDYSLRMATLANTCKILAQRTLRTENKN
ncbi:MAG: DUF1836 domain-containing protein [Christensenellales bacterium]|jgi:hypothetical protein